MQPPILPEKPPEGPLVLVSPGPTVPQEEGPNLTAFQDKEQKNDLLAAGGVQEGAAYPLVWRHPDTDVGAIMAHTLILERLRSSDRGEAGWELSWEESEAEVASLLEAATQPPHILVHNWRPRDLVIWCAPASAGCMARRQLAQFDGPRGRAGITCARFTPSPRGKRTRRRGARG